MHLLDVVATEEQRERYLRPLAAGEIRSCFAMTEPAPGAGSDPSMLRDDGGRVDGGWRIDGRKWFITGADGAGVRDLHGPQRRTATAAARRCSWSTPTTRACAVGAHIGTLDAASSAGTARSIFDGCLVGDDACSARSAGASSTPRYGWPRPG